ncbi:MAG: DUF2974 domain-containing protein [Treponema sp.]|nr:DUF2974 domain-containing protein [Treponema sp.]
MDILDYIYWRGDIPFEVSPLNEIDALILCQLSYLNFKGLEIASFKTDISLQELSQRFVTSKDYATRANMGLLINEKTPELLVAASKSLRFREIGVCGFTTELHEDTEEQFAAITYIIKDIHNQDMTFVAFRGTDDTVVGWKEDFNLAFMTPVPAQRDALSYVKKVSDTFAHNALVIGGHSKGGNLALYSSALSEESVQQHIKQVYNFDGPGLVEDVTKLEGYKAMSDIMYSLYPKCSVIGMLFERTVHYHIVESSEFGVMQHDPFSWFIDPRSFVTVSDFESASKFVDKTINTWLMTISKEEREQFVTVLFSVIAATGVKTSSELSKNWLTNSGTIIKAYSELPSEARKAVKLILEELFKQGIDSIGELLSFF